MIWRNDCSGGEDLLERCMYSNNVGVWAVESLVICLYASLSSRQRSINVLDFYLAGRYFVSVFETSFSLFILPECWNFKVSYWTEPLHMIKCPHFSQYCNKSSFSTSTISQTRRRFCQGYKIVVLHATNYKGNIHIWTYFYDAFEHCKLQREVHLMLCGD